MVELIVNNDYDGDYENVVVVFENGRRFSIGNDGKFFEWKKEWVLLKEAPPHSCKESAKT